MNTFQSINTEYIRPSRTIETVLVCNKNTEKLFYIYNYECNSFRVFEELLALLDFFQNGTENCLYFDSDDEVDIFLELVKLLE